MDIIEATVGELQDLEKRALTAPESELGTLAGALASLRERLALLRSRQAAKAAADLAQRQDAEQRAAERARAEAQAACRSTAAALSQRWAAFGRDMTACDAEARRLWAEYRDLTRGAFDLALASKAAGLEQVPMIDTSAAAGAILRSITAGASPICDWHLRK